MSIIHTQLKSHKSPCWLRHFGVKSGKKQSINDIFHSPFSTKMRRQRTVLSDSTKPKKTLLSVSLLQSGVERERESHQGHSSCCCSTRAKLCVGLYLLWTELEKDGMNLAFTRQFHRNPCQKQMSAIFIWKNWWAKMTAKIVFFYFSMLNLRLPLRICSSTSNDHWCSCSQL
jgi:hypothetical protein